MSHSIDNRGNLIAVCGNSGSGKSTLVRHALTEMPTRLSYMNTFTTRERRPNEDSIEYTFVEDGQYDYIKAQSRLWDESIIYGNRYGLDAATYIDILDNGGNIVVCSIPSNDVMDEMRSIYGSEALKTIHLLTDIETSREQATRRDRETNLARVAFDSMTAYDADFHADYSFAPSGVLAVDQPRFTSLIRSIIL